MVSITRIHTIEDRIEEINERIEDLETALESAGIDTNPHRLNGSGKTKPSDNRFSDEENE